MVSPPWAAPVAQLSKSWAQAWRDYDQIRAADPGALSISVPGAKTFQKIMLNQ
jgi:hypothetical protein